MTPHAATEDATAVASAPGDLGALQPMVETLTRVTIEVFERMVNRPVTASAPPALMAKRPPAGAIGSVGFAGSANGIVSFGAPHEAALEITAALLCMEPGEVENDVADAIGEVTNMVAGAFRTQMAANGNGWSITMPVVTMGQGLRVGYPSGATRVLCEFTMGTHALFVELVLQAD